MESFKTECKVSGILRAILFISRVAGVVPLSFESFHDECRIRISKAATAYGKIVTTIISVLAITSVVFALMMDYGKSHPRLKSDRVLSAFILILVGPVGLLASFTGVKRMAHFINHQTQLEKINMELIKEHRGMAPSSWQFMTSVVFFLILGNFTVYTDYAIFMYKGINNEVPVQWLSLEIFYYMIILLTQLVAIQFSMITYSVLSSYRLLNDSLKQFLKSLAGQTPVQNRMDVFDEKPKHVLNELYNELLQGQPVTTFATLRRLTFLYNSLCGVVQAVNASHGVLLMQLLLSCFSFLIISPFHLLNSLKFQTLDDVYQAALCFLWVVFHFSNLTFIVEPCHQTHEEMVVTKSLISKLMLYAPPSQDSLNIELLHLYRYLKLDETSYSPLGMFALSRGLVMTMMASVTTYLVIVVTF